MPDDTNSEEKKASISPPRLRFNPEITYGQVLNSLLIVGGFGWAVMTYAARVDVIQHDVAALRTDMNARLDDVSVKFRDLRSDIANLPDVRAELSQLEKRMDQGDARNSAQSDRMDKIESMSFQNNAELKSIQLLPLTRK